MNIDGVIAGNYRTGFAGLDINRMFGEQSNKRLNPEAFMLKDYIKIEKKQNRLEYRFFKYIFKNFKFNSSQIILLACRGK